MDPKMLARMARVCRKQGIVILKTADIEITLGPLPAKEKEPRAKLIEVKLPQNYAALTDDELLFGGGK